VSFFFILSGFILMTTYWNRFNGRLRWDDARAFYKARFARVYPLLFVTTILAAIGLAFLGEGLTGAFGPIWTGTSSIERIAKLLATLSLLQPWLRSPGLVLGVNPPTWSIGAEAFFYAVFPFAAWCASRITRFSPVLLTASFVGSAWILQLTIAAVADKSLKTYYLPPVRFCEFAMGMLTALTFLRHRAPAARRLAASLIELVTLAIVALGLLTMPRFGHISASLLLSPLFAYAIYVFALGRGFITRGLSAPSLMLLGEASYAFYLIHHPVLEMTSLLIRSPLVEAVVSLAISVMLSIALFHTVEVPLRRLLRGDATRGSIPEQRPTTIRLTHSPIE
jgi:peptidoglycan/LPS O-acetylase OafA/YrhL